MTLPALILLALLPSPAWQEAEVPVELPPDEAFPKEDALEVTLVSAPGESEIVNVVSHGATAHEVLARLAEVAGRAFKLEAGETQLRAGQPVDVNLHRRTLADATRWVAGAAGLIVRLTKKELFCAADADQSAPEEMLRRAVDAWRLSLLHNPTHPDEPRLRFQIGNALYQLGDWDGAIRAYEGLEEIAPQFGDLAYAYFRSGHAHAKKGDEAGAQTQWLQLQQVDPGHPLVAAARLEAVQSFRRQGDMTNATIVLRLVVEGMRNGLTPADLVTAGELLAEGGDTERGIAALQWALQATSDPVLDARGLVALARAQATRRDWPAVIETAQRFISGHPDDLRAAELYHLVALAHQQLDDPFTALLAIRSARELKPDQALVPHLDLLEGELYAACGLSARAIACLSRAGAAEEDGVAAPALALHAGLLREAGQFEASGQVFERLALLKGHEVEAAIGIAETCLLQHNWKRCVAIVQPALLRADETQRARLLELAGNALREGDASASLLDALAAGARLPETSAEEKSDDR